MEPFALFKLNVPCSGATETVKDEAFKLLSTSKSLFSTLAVTAVLSDVTTVKSCVTGASFTGVMVINTVSKAHKKGIPLSHTLHTK